MILRQLQRMLEHVEAEAEQCTKLAEHFRCVIDYINESDLDSGTASMPGTGNALRDGMEKVLEAEGKPLHPRVVVERLEHRGVMVHGQNPVSNARAHMSGDERFEAVGDGNWGLVKWNLNKE